MFIYIVKLRSECCRKLEKYVNTTRQLLNGIGLTTSCRPPLFNLSQLLQKRYFTSERLGQYKYACKDMIKARPASRELNSVGINPCVGPDPRASLGDLHLGLGPTLGLIPDLVLPSRLVSSIYLIIS